MKAIQVKYLCPTNYRGARLKAMAEGVKPLTISYPEDKGQGEPAFRVAAEQLAVSLGWLGNGKHYLVGGALPSRDWCFCFAPCQSVAPAGAARKEGQ